MIRRGELSVGHVHRVQRRLGPPSRVATFGTMDFHQVKW